ncbi:MAG: hypothetical protein A7315_03150 [Candidatus Altiarchaeales archaeon WOR_SM1_79]|nr:MAG: hypothetical protein A7315_03150 [Candidatus Altiarchaeales archaeon WOR_SM1_79]
MNEIFTNFELTPSQEEGIKEIEKKVNRPTGRSIFILNGKAGSGKTFLIKDYIDQKGGEYYNISKNHLKELFKYEHTKITPIEFREFIEKIDEKHSNTFIVLDECNPIFLSFQENKLLDSFLTICGRHSSSKNNIILLIISDVFNTSRYDKDRIIGLKFNENDAKVINRNCDRMYEGEDNIYEIINKKLENG